MSKAQPYPSEATGGQRMALDAAIELHYGELCAAVRRRGIDSSLAVEVVHDLYINLATTPEKLSRATSLKAFLTRAAVNLGIDRIRRIGFEKRLFTVLDSRAEDVPYACRSVDALLDVPRRAKALHQAILDLPPQCRLVFIGHRIGGISKDEIAEQLGIRRRMVDRHLRNALLHCIDRMDTFE